MGDIKTMFEIRLENVGEEAAICDLNEQVFARQADVTDVVKYHRAFNGV